MNRRFFIPARRHIKKPLFGEAGKVVPFPKRSWAAVLSHSRPPPFYMGMAAVRR